MLKGLSLLVLCVQLLSVSARAVDPATAFDMINGTALAQNLAYSKNINEFSTTLRLSSSDKKLFADDLKKGNLGQKPTPGFTYEGGVFHFEQQSQKIVIDFRKLDQRQILINGYTVNIQQYVPYLQAQIVIRDILAQRPRTTLFDFLIPQAQAAKDDGSYSLWAILISSTSSDLRELSYDSASINIQATLVQSYKNIIAGWRNSDPDAEHILDRFTCKNHHLHTIQNVVVNSNMVQTPADKTNYIDPDKLEYIPGTGYRGHFLANDSISEDHPKHSTCEVTAGLSGSIETSTGIDCPKVGDNLFKITHNGASARWGDLPRIAAACCELDKCEAMVNAAIEQSFAKNKPQITPESGSGAD